MKNVSNGIDFSAKFLKQHKKSPIEIQRAWIKRLLLFKQDKFHPQLKNHQLTGKMKTFRSINITGDWRAIYSLQHDTIVFELLGTHSQLYK